MFSDNDDNERFKNLLLYRIWATDEEIEEVAPILFILLVIIGIVAICLFPYL